MKDNNRQQTANNAVPGRPSLLKRKRVVIAGVVVALALALLTYVGVSQFSTYYLTVSEFVAEQDSLHDKQIRVTGQVVADSMNWDAETVTLSFILADGEASLPVYYQGVIPDMFKEGSDVVVEGKYDLQGVFYANKLITACPSKYEPSE